jgi:hypothetical protein
VSCSGNVLDDTITGTGAVPDLLGTAQPTATCTTPPCYGTDIGCSSGTGSGGGLPLQPSGASSCATAPSSNSQSHSWVTPTISAGTTWSLTGTGTMTTYVESGMATPVNATLCLAIYALPSGLGGLGGLFGNQIGATVSASVYAAAGVPTPVTFDFNLGSGTYTIASTGLARVEVVVWIANTSSAVDLVYDQAQFASQVTFLLQT